MNSPGPVNNNNYRNIRNFVINYINVNSFAGLWGRPGTVASDGTYRIDIQNPAPGYQNIQVQQGSNTVATVLVNTNLAQLPNGNTAQRQAAQIELMNQVRGALINSANSVRNNNARNFKVEGTFSNAPPSHDGLRRRLKTSPPLIFEIFAGPIDNGEEAKEICPKTTESLKTQWNGQWYTTRSGEMSMCQGTAK